MLDYEVFAANMKRLVNVFTPRAWSEATEAEYYSALQSIEDRQFRGAVDLAIRECEYMPRPAEIRKLAERASLIQHFDDSRDHWRKEE